MGSSPRLGRIELRIMEALWQGGPLSIRQIHDSFPAKKRQAYTTVQTLVSRLEAKKAIRRTQKVGKAHIYEALISREAAQSRLVDDILSLFGGRAAPLMSRLIESGRLTARDIEEAQEAIRRHDEKHGKR